MGETKLLEIGAEGSDWRSFGLGRTYAPFCVADPWCTLPVMCMTMKRWREQKRGGEALGSEISKFQNLGERR